VAAVLYGQIKFCHGGLRGASSDRGGERKVRPGQTILRRKVVLAAISLIGLLLAVAAMTPAAVAVESLPARLVLDLPAWLAIPFVVLMGLEALFILLVLASGAPRRKVALPPRKSMVPGLLLLLAVLLLIGLRDNLGDLGRLVPDFAMITGVPEQVAAPGADEPPPVQAPLLSGLQGTFLLVLAALGFAVMVWLFLGLRPERGSETPPPLASSDWQAAIEDSLDDLRRLPDARLAIIRCYDRFEKVLAGADVRRPPWETAAEFMRTALRQPWLPRESVRELTSLFEIARFSRHELGPDHRERAWQALMAVKAALEKEDRHASTA
jgi:hypothetical protein